MLWTRHKFIMALTHRLLQVCMGFLRCVTEISASGKNYSNLQTHTLNIPVRQDKSLSGAHPLHVLTIDNQPGHALGCADITGVDIRVVLLQILDGERQDTLFLGHLIPTPGCQLCVTFEPRHTGWDLSRLTLKGHRILFLHPFVSQCFSKFMDGLC